MTGYVYKCMNISNLPQAMPPYHSRLSPPRATAEAAQRPHASHRPRQSADPNRRARPCRAAIGRPQGPRHFRAHPRETPAAAIASAATCDFEYLKERVRD